jgi:acyl carrier protein
MTEPEIYAALETVFEDVFDDKVALTPATTAADVRGWDSQAHVALIVATEMRFNIRFRTAEFEKLGNVGDLVRLIGEKVAKH